MGMYFRDSFLAQCFLLREQSFENFCLHDQLLVMRSSKALSKTQLQQVSK